jgi:hypothetical protein
MVRGADLRIAEHFKVFGLKMLHYGKDGGKS